MTNLLNRARVAVATTGTGTVTLGAAISKYVTLADAGAVNGLVYPYVLEEGNDFEIGYGTYSSSGPSFSRDTVLMSCISGTKGTTKMTLAGNAALTIVPVAEVILSLAADTDLKNPTSAALASPPNYLDLHPYHPKFACSWSYATAALPNTVSAVNSTTDVTTINSHGLSTGAFCYTSAGSMPAGWVSGAGYFARVIDANNVQWHPTYEDAIANTNRLDLTNTTTGGTLRQITITLYGGNSLAAPGPVVPKAAVATEQFTLRLLRSYSNLWYGSWLVFFTSCGNRVADSVGAGVDYNSAVSKIVSGSQITFSASNVPRASGATEQNWNTNTGSTKPWKAILFGE